MATPVTLKIKFKSPTVDHFVERYSVDVSEDGIFIRTPKPLSVGTAVNFRFQLQDGNPLMNGAGTVVWIREMDPAKAAVSPGMGIRFDKLPSDGKAVVERIVDFKKSAEQFSEEPTVAGDSQQALEMANAAQAAQAAEALADTVSAPAHEPTIESSQASVARRLKAFGVDVGAKDAAAAEAAKDAGEDVQKLVRDAQQGAPEPSLPAAADIPSVEMPPESAMPEPSFSEPVASFAADKEKPSRAIWIIIGIVAVLGVGLYLYLRSAGSKPAPKARPAASIPAKPAAPAPVSLDLSSTPAGAKVLVDGQDTGNVTPTRLAKLDPTREIELTFELPGKKRVVKRLKPVAGVSVAAELTEPTERVIQFTSTPEGAKVYLDGQKVGVTPVDYSDAVEDGVVHRVTFRLAGHRDANLEIPADAQWQRDGDGELLRIATELGARPRSSATRTSAPAPRRVAPSPKPDTSAPARVVTNEEVSPTGSTADAPAKAKPASDPAAGVPGALPDSEPVPRVKIDE